MDWAAIRMLPMAAALALLFLSRAPAQEGYGESLTMVGETGQSNRGAPATTASINYVNGKVTIDDGTPPPADTLVEGYCDGRRVFIGHSDSRGRFSIRMAPNAAAGTAPVLTPSWAQRGSFDDFRGRSSDCAVTASLPGHRSSSAALLRGAGMGAPRVGTIILRRVADIDGLTISATTLEAPRPARKAYQKGVKAARKRKWRQAREALEQAVALYPKYAVAWFELGNVHRNAARPVDARAAYAKSIACDPKYISPDLRLAAMDAGRQNWAAVLARTERILRLNPYDFAEAYLYSALSNLWLGNLVVAEKRARQAVERDPHQNHPRARLILGLTQAQLGRLSEAEARLRQYLEMEPSAADAPQIRAEADRIAALQARARRR